MRRAKLQKLIKGNFLLKVITGRAWKAGRYLEGEMWEQRNRWRERRNECKCHKKTRILCLYTVHLDLDTYNDISYSSRLMAFTAH